jgi:polysaccharide export outer membrane protein
MNRFLLSCIVGLFLISSLDSCLSAKRMYFFNDQTQSVQNLDSSVQFSENRIQKLDRILITISSTDPSLTAFLNPLGATASGTTSGGYLVNNSGTIEFPLLGKVKVEGLTTVEASVLLREKLTYYYKDLFVNVNLLGKVYFISGKNSAKISIENERLTIFEALAQAGPISPYDKKDQMWLVREDSGQRKFVKLDLNSKKIFESPYYYLKNNDLLYLQPNKNSSLLSTDNPIRVFITLTGALSAILLFISKL